MTTCKKALCFPLPLPLVTQFLCYTECSNCSASDLPVKYGFINKYSARFMIFHLFVWKKKTKHQTFTDVLIHQAKTNKQTKAILFLT